MSAPFGEIRLRGFRNADTLPLFEYITDPEVNRQLVVMLPADPPMLAQAATRMTTGLDGDFAFVVTEASIDAAIGFARLLVDEPSGASISYFLGRQFWGRGYGAQIVDALAELGFARLRLARLKAQVFGGNTRSIRLLTSAGFALRETHDLNGGDPLREIELHFEATPQSFRRRAPRTAKKPFGDRVV